MKDAVDEILKLNPKPGGGYSDPHSKVAEHVIPDFVLENEEGELQLSLNSRNVPELRVSRTYSEMLNTYSGGAKGKASHQLKDAASFVKQKMDSARWFIDAIRQRQNTLMVTMEAIIEYQEQYFQDGDEKLLHPMILKDIADKTGLDISTISRVANSKYIQTHFGIFPLKYFFSEGMQTDSGEEVSTREIKKILEECIENESKLKPLTDDELADILQKKGYQIARRTVAKYREQLNISVARLRKEL
jgi:RNA polymerase sigma-54 factor